MQMMRFNLTALALVVLSSVSLAEPTWAAEGPINKSAAYAMDANAKLRAQALAKKKHMAQLRAAQLAKLRNASVAPKPTLVQQALAIAETARGGDIGGYSDRPISYRSQFTSASMKDAIAKLRQAAGIR
ncbi:hypothetical protein [Hyphomicrobium sp.]|uniref:hypothetical protein n=1 Tax=Hyphomicrobium sp. TaxID=82 RepID=UPI000FA12231|nr:hypothetical protein [Hyphomicrobium sp.]RUP09041.1 MAG: hypothetical protein EKK38_10375 [Hyphomicrobium sp.]